MRKTTRPGYHPEKNPLTSAVEEIEEGYRRAASNPRKPLTSAVKEKEESYKFRVSSRENPLTSAVEETDEGYRQAYGGVQL